MRQCVLLTQHPVGQGGMMSGLIELRSGTQFQWVYDCGSDQTKELDREIDVVAARGDIDYLFISHLDSDHVNGIASLLAKTKVREVVLPYLSNIDRIIAIISDHLDGGVTDTFLDFLGDINGWFGDLGVERVTLITPRRNDDPNGIEQLNMPDMPDTQEFGEGRVEDIISARWSLAPKQNDSNGSGSVEQVLEENASLKMMVGSTPLNWLLAPYAHGPSKGKLAAFKAALLKEFPEWVSQDFTLKVLQDPEMRNRLRDCYKKIWSSHNRVSMALYSGPIKPIESFRVWFTRLSTMHRKHFISSRAFGWLGTGDMHLDATRRLQSFVIYYKNVFKHVNVFSLPHHGSRHNFDKSLFVNLPQPLQCVAPVGPYPNQHGHPSRSVRQAVLDNQKVFVRVTTKACSVLRWIVCF